MKKKALIIAAALAGMLILTACGTDENGGSGSGTAAGGGTSGTQAVSGTQVVQGDGGAGTGTSGQDQQGGSVSGEGQQSGGTSGQDQQSPGGSGEDQQNAGDSSQEQQGGEDQEDVLSDVPSVDEDEDSAAAEDIWSGTYVGDGETVTVTKLGEDAISFSFAQSGISGTAAVNGYQAVYNGDDHHVVVFNISGTVLDVSVSSEEDYDASASPLNGTYVKEA